MSEILESVINDLTIENITNFTIRGDDTLEFVENQNIHQIPYKSQELLLSDVKALAKYYRQQLTYMNEVDKAFCDKKEEINREFASNKRTSFKGKILVILLSFLPMLISAFIPVIFVKAILISMSVGIFAKIIPQFIKEHFTSKREYNDRLQYWDTTINEGKGIIKQYSDIISYLETLIVTLTDEQKKKASSVLSKEELCNLRLEVNKIMNEQTVEMDAEVGRQHMKR